MSVAAFDPDAIMHRVRAAAKASALAKSANPLRVEAEFSGLAELAASPASRAESDALDDDAVAERMALCADAVPTVFLDAWARINHRKPVRVGKAAWRLALDDGGRFLDCWGPDAAALGWTVAHLFALPSGLVWRLAGRSVEGLGPRHVRLDDGERITLNVDHDEDRR